MTASVFVPIQRDGSGAEELKQFCSAALGQINEQLSTCLCISILVSGSGSAMVGGCGLFHMLCMQGAGISASRYQRQTLKASEMVFRSSYMVTIVLVLSIPDNKKKCKTELYSGVGLLSLQS